METEVPIVIHPGYGGFSLNNTIIDKINKNGIFRNDILRDDKKHICDCYCCCLKLRTCPTLIKIIKDINENNKDKNYTELTKILHEELGSELIIEYIPIEAFKDYYFEINEFDGSERINIYWDKIILKLQRKINLFMKYILYEKDITDKERIESLKMIYQYDKLNGNTNKETLNMLREITTNIEYYPGFGKYYLNAKTSYDKINK